MWKKLLTETILEIKVPERRLNILMPIIGLVIVASVTVSLYTARDKDLHKQIDDLSRELYKKDSVNDVLREDKRVLNNKVFTTQTEANADKIDFMRETLKKLENATKKVK